MLNVIVVDAQGGGLGASVVKKLVEKYVGRICLTAAGTNARATASMKKSGAANCATGEAAICDLARSADVIIGGIGIIAASGMLGEITPRIARAIAESDAKKILIPISRCSIIIPGAKEQSAKALIDLAAAELESLL
jgi:hypothetical protein